MQITKNKNQIEGYFMKDVNYLTLIKIIKIWI